MSRNQPPIGPDRWLPSRACAARVLEPLRPRHEDPRDPIDGLLNWMACGGLGDAVGRPGGWPDLLGGPCDADTLHRGRRHYRDAARVAETGSAQAEALFGYLVVVAHGLVHHGVRRSTIEPERLEEWLAAAAGESAAAGRPDLARLLGDAAMAVADPGATPG